MRGNFGLFKNVNGVIGSTGVGNGVKFVSCSGFSSSSGGDGYSRGRGRGGSVPPKFDLVASQSRKDDSGEERGGLDGSGPFSGHGHGRGKTLPATFDVFPVSKQPVQQPGVGRGRGGNERSFEPKKHVFIAKDQGAGLESVVESVSAAPQQPIGEKNLPSSILSVFSGGAGRGKPERNHVFDVGAKEENRHLRPRQAPRDSDAVTEARRGQEADESRGGGSSRRPPKMSREEAVKKAVGLLSQPDKVVGKYEGGGGRGKGDGKRRGDRRQQRYQGEDEVEDEDEGLYAGDDADGEKFAQFLGPERMNELTEAFEDMGGLILPDPEEDEFIEALETNLKIELEPEYMLGDLERNPNFDENPPMSLREVLERQKQFLVAYEGIENNEEWEEYVKDAMQRVPVLEEIVDYYCGPDKVTAKKQQQELDRVAKTLPATAPDSWKRFTDNALLSLQSNPGWEFHRKWQFMDKLVLEASKSYK